MTILGYDCDDVKNDADFEKVLAQLAYLETCSVGCLYGSASNTTDDSAEDILEMTGKRGLFMLVNRYRPMRFLPIALFPEDWNELILITDHNQELVPAANIRPLRADQQNLKLVITNRPLQYDKPEERVRQWMYLRCRFSSNLQSVSSNRQGLLRRISAEDVPERQIFRSRVLRIPDIDLRRAWLGVQRSNAHIGRYTFGDAFCGAGGASRGAALAGFSISWGFDIDSIAGSSYRRNFPAATFHQIDAQQFHAIPPEEIHVDVLHLSPSCQAFSAMNTTEDGGKNGEYNRDSFLSCLNIIQHVRPRIITMEQVPGILFERSAAYFANFVRDLIDLGFSVMWQILRCDFYNVPQARKRLILLASCPGHALPSVPAGLESLRRPTVNDFLRPCERQPYFDVTWPATIVTKGAQGPDGTSLTVSQLQAIQSFPYDHSFSGSRIQMTRQIGNAVPPELAKSVFIEVMRALRKVDNERASCKY